MPSAVGGPSSSVCSASDDEIDHFDRYPEHLTSLVDEPLERSVPLKISVISSGDAFDLKHSLLVVRELEDGTKARLSPSIPYLIVWFRVISDGSVKKIVDSSSPKYQTTADDVNSELCCQVGVGGSTLKTCCERSNIFTCGPIRIDSNLENSLNRRVARGAARFDVEEKLSHLPLSLYFSGRQVIFTLPGTRAVFAHALFSFYVAPNLCSTHKIRFAH